LFLQRTNKMS